MASEHVVNLTEATYAEGTAKNVVLVDFWAAWCGPCRAMEPIIDQLAEKYAGNKNVTIAKLDTEAAEDLPAQLKIMSLPTFSVYVNGQEVERFVGTRPAPFFEERVEAALAKLQTAPPA